MSVYNITSKLYFFLLSIFIAGSVCSGCGEAAPPPTKDSVAVNDSDSYFELCTFRPATSKKRRGGRGREPAAVGEDAIFWDHDDIIVTFMEGDERVKEKIKNTARKWEEHCGIRFQFTNVAPEEADIVIALNDSEGTWSCMGSESRRQKPSMNFSDLNWRSRQSKYDYYVLHEFGHALGLIHEHQNPDADIPWDSGKVYDHFATNQNPPWSRGMVDSNIFMRYSADRVSHTTHDKKSIMIYAISSNWTKGGIYHTEATTAISDTDKVYIQSKYPKRTAGN